MGNQYGSFLLRCWSRDGQPQRVEIEHIQSGERTRMPSVDLAAQWIDAQLNVTNVENVEVEVRRTAL